jgi:hypothetical protein
MVRMWMSGTLGAMVLSLVLWGVVGSTDAAAGAPPAKAAEGRSSPDADEAHRRQDIERHRTMAAAHGAAAGCLASGKAEKECHEALREACKGIAVGRYCGMRHAH